MLHLLPEDERVAGLLKLGQVLELVGEWENAEEINREAERLAGSIDDAQSQAQSHRALGWLLRKGASTARAKTVIAAREGYQHLDYQAGVSHVLADIGEIYRLQGKYTEARAYYDESLNLAATIAEHRIRQKTGLMRSKEPELWRPGRVIMPWPRTEPGKPGSPS